MFNALVLGAWLSGWRFVIDARIFRSVAAVSQEFVSWFHSGETAQKNAPASNAPADLLDELGGASLVEDPLVEDRQDAASREDPPV